MGETSEKTEEKRSPLWGAVRRILWACIGVVALARDEIEGFVDKLVERGKTAEKDSESLVRDLMERRKTPIEKAEKELDERIEELLHRMNVPTKSDIEALNAQITQLIEKVDELE